VVTYGNARVTEGAAVPLLQRLAPITSDRRRTIRRPPCVTLRVMSPGSPRHASLGLVRGFNKPLGDYESCVSLSRQLHEASGRPRAARPAAALGSQLSALS
jgi:hypothetical protein